MRRSTRPADSEARDDSLETVQDVDPKSDAVSCKARSSGSAAAENSNVVPGVAAANSNAAPGVGDAAVNARESNIDPNNHRRPLAIQVTPKARGSNTVWGSNPAAAADGAHEGSKADAGTMDLDSPKARSSAKATAAAAALTAIATKTLISLRCNEKSTATAREGSKAWGSNTLLPRRPALVWIRRRATRFRR